MSQQKQRLVPNLTVDAIVIRQQKQNYEILLINRGKNPFKDHLALPGGFVDYNEDPEDAVLRELKEETSLDGEIPVRLITVRGANDDAADAKFYSLEDILANKYKLAFDHLEIIREFGEWFNKEGKEWFSF